MRYEPIWTFWIRRRWSGPPCTPVDDAGNWRKDCVGSATGWCRGLRSKREDVDDDGGVGDEGLEDLVSVSATVVVVTVESSVVAGGVDSVASEEGGTVVACKTTKAQYQTPCKQLTICIPQSGVWQLQNVQCFYDQAIHARTGDRTMSGRHIKPSMSSTLAYPRFHWDHKYRSGYC